MRLKRGGWSSVEYRLDHGNEVGTVLTEDEARAAWTAGEGLRVERAGRWAIIVSSPPRRSINVHLSTGWRLSWKGTPDGYLRFDEAWLRQAERSITFQFAGADRLRQRVIIPDHAKGGVLFSPQRVHVHVQADSLRQPAVFGEWERYAIPFTTHPAPWVAPQRLRWTDDLWPLPTLRSAGLERAAKQVTALLPKVDPGLGTRFAGAYVKVKDYRSAVEQFPEFRYDTKQRRWIAEHVSGNRVVSLHTSHDALRGVGISLGCYAGHSGWAGDAPEWWQATRPEPYNPQGWRAITDADIAHYILDLTVRLWHETCDRIDDASIPTCVSADEPPKLYT